MSEPRGRERIEEPERLGTWETVRIFLRALRYVAPFKGVFAVKAALLLLSLVPLVVLPWPIKIIVDHVIEARPIGPALNGYPGFLRPFLVFLDGRSPVEILAWTVAFQLGLFLLVGAFGTGDGERDSADARLASGHDTATRTENQANAGWSLAGGLLGLLDFRWTLRLTQSLNHHYRSQLFERIQSLPMTSFDDERIGDAVYRVMYDTPAITNTVYRLLLTPLAAPLLIIASASVIGAVFGQHPLLVWSALAFLPLAFLTSLPFAAAVRRRSGSSRKAGALTTSTAEEGMANILAVQSLGGETRQRERFDADSWGSFGRYRALFRLWLGAFLVAALPGALIVGNAFLYVSDLVIAGSLTRGDFTALFSYFMQILSAALDLGALWFVVQDDAAGLRRVFYLMDQPAERDPPVAVGLPPLREGLRIEDVYFDYPDGTPGLRGVSMTARRGQVIALAGPAGAGKTTLAYLVPRFLEPTRGRVSVDGTDLARVSMASLRRQVAFVFQETALFDMTVEENIRVGQPDASDAEVRRAARTAGADEFVRSLPQGYATPLGRAGGKLSVGQKQRLAIARALVRDAAILILDEPTSALDPQTERQLVAALREASRDRIVLVIAHRLSTIREADQILFLERGRILERGTHAELMARRDGAYRRFVRMQTRGAA